MTKSFSEKHPAAADNIDTLLSVLYGSFALLATVDVWIKELIKLRKK